LGTAVPLIEEFSLDKVGAVGAARTTGVPADRIAKFKATSRGFQAVFI
jgi:hypothetical protein